MSHRLLIRMLSACLLYACLVSGLPSVSAAQNVVTNLTLGYSTEGRPITALRIGNGPRKLVLVGATHGGPEANTYRLMNELIVHFQSNPEEVPATIRLYLIPTLNPDGLAHDSRLNARTIDLNRNMNTNLDRCPENDWNRTVNGARGIVSNTGGDAPESEVESRLIRDFLLDAAGAIFYHSAGGELFPAFCEHEPSIRFAQAYATAAGYTYMRYYPRYHITGGMHDWAGSMGIASFTPELWNGNDTDMEANHTAIHAVFDQAEELLPLPEDHTEAGITIPAAIWRFWRSRGGPALFGMPIAPAQRTGGHIVQYFERVVIEQDSQAADTTTFVQLALVDPSERQHNRAAERNVSPEVEAQLVATWQRWGGSVLFGAALSAATIDIRQNVVTKLFARAELEYDANQPTDPIRLAPLGWRAWHRHQISAPTLANQIR